MLISWMFTISINKTFVIEDMFDSFHTTSHKPLDIYICLPPLPLDVHSNKVSRVIVAYENKKVIWLSNKYMFNLWLKLL